MSDSENTHTYQVKWHPPQKQLQAAQTMNGLDYFRAMVAGKIPPPPIASLMGFTMEEAEEGRVVFAVTPQEIHYNPMGTVHGGLAATLLDSAMTCAIQSTLPKGIASTTIELHINYIRPITSQTGRLRCIGEIIHVGRTIATAKGRVVDENDKLYAHGTTTCMVFSITPAPQK
ncbi:MAG: PaaI family thioesterase [Chloroflexi bacterium]|nr:MAG: PaaI family thioesterase [Chloroflexota bacterium]